MISEEEFDRIQNQLIKLRTENYDLQSKVSGFKKEKEKVKKAYDALDRDFKKASTIISKSKEKQAIRNLVEDIRQQKMLNKTLSEEYEQQITSLRESIGILMSNNSELTGKVEEMAVEKSNIVQEHETAEKELALLLGSEKAKEGVEERVIKVEAFTQTTDSAVISIDELKSRLEATSEFSEENMQKISKHLSEEDGLLVAGGSISGEVPDIDNERESELQLLKERLIVFEKEIEKLKDEEKETRQKNEGIIAEKEVVLARLNGKIHEMTEQMKVQDGKNAELLEKISHTTETLKRAEEDCKRSLEAENVLKEQLSASLVTKSKDEEEISKLNDKISSASKMFREEEESRRKESDALKMENAKNLEIIEKLEQNLENLRSKSEKTEKQLEAKVNTLDLSLRASAGNRNKYERLSAEREKENLELKEMMSKSEKRFQLNIKKMKENEGRVKRMKDEVEQLKATVAEKESWILKLEESVKIVQANFQEEAEKAARYLTSLTELQSMQVELEGKYNEAIESSQSEKASLKEKLDEKTQEFDDLYAEFEGKQAELSTLKKEAEDVDKSLKESRESVVILTEELTRTSEEYNICKREREEWIQKFEKEVDRLNVKIEDVRIEEGIEEKKKDNLIIDLKRQLKRESERVEILESQQRNELKHKRRHSNSTTVAQAGHSRLLSTSEIPEMTSQSTRTSPSASFVNMHGGDSVLRENIQLRERVADLEDSMILLSSELQQKNSIIEDLTKKSVKRSNTGSYTFKIDRVKEADDLKKSRKSMMGLRTKSKTDIEKEKLQRIDLILEETLQKNIKLHDDIFIMGETVDRLSKELEKMKSENVFLREKLKETNPK